MRPSFISSETSESLTLQERNIIFYYARGEYYTTFFRLAFLLSFSSIKIILILFVIRNLQVLESFAFFFFHQTFESVETKLNFLIKKKLRISFICIQYTFFLSMN